MPSNRVIALLKLGNVCHGFGVFDKAVRWETCMTSEDGVVEDSKTVASKFEKGDCPLQSDEFPQSTASDWLTQLYLPNVSVGNLNLDVTQPVAASGRGC